MPTSVLATALRFIIELIFEILRNMYRIISYFIGKFMLRISSHLSAITDYLLEIIFLSKQ